MQTSAQLSHEFVEFIPEILCDGVVYVSIPYSTAAHKCFCGCGTKVVTPISPTDWSLGFNGESISLDPSIGNWSLPCQSHYWIDRGRIVWAARWSEQRISRARERDRAAKQDYYAEKERDQPKQLDVDRPIRRTMWNRLLGVLDRDSELD